MFGLVCLQVLPLIAFDCNPVNMFPLSLQFNEALQSVNYIHTDADSEFLNNILFFMGSYILLYYIILYLIKI